VYVAKQKVNTMLTTKNVMSSVSQNPMIFFIMSDHYLFLKKRNLNSLIGEYFTIAFP
jgi:hypothetical protein